MMHAAGLLLLASLPTWAAPAIPPPMPASPAGSPAASPPGPADDDDLAENTITGARPIGPVVATEGTVSSGLGALEAPPALSSQVAAAALGSDVALVEATRAAVELVYARRYKEARRALDSLGFRYSTVGVGPVGMALVYQAMMFENYDFRYERQYRASFDQARAQLAAGAKVPGDDALEAFLGAGLVGVDAIHAMRKGELLTALSRALEAMKGLERTRTLAPAFKDALLGDGLYLYWRSVVTRSSRALPDFPDRRAEGVARMREAERGATFLGAGATLALAFAHIEERQLPQALERCLSLRLRYPDNIVSNMTLGRVYTSLRRYDDALRVYREIRVDDPSNQRVHYFLGLVQARMGNDRDAEKAYQTYLGFNGLQPDQRGQTWYRLGSLYAKRGDRARAEAAFEASIKSNGNDAARRALERQRSHR